MCRGGEIEFTMVDSGKPIPCPKCGDKNDPGPVTSEEIGKLYEANQVLIDRLKKQERGYGTVHAQVWLERAQYDIHGAFAYMAMKEEQDDGR
jgi:hypothetical protein